MSYIGNEPIVSATRTITEVTATAGQTVFTANGGYTVGYIDVFLNGAQLQTVDFTATNGTTITLTEAAQVGDVLKLVAWGTFSTATHVPLTGDSNITGNINVSGNLGVGTTSPVSLGAGYGTVDVRGSSGGGFRWGSAANSSYTYSDSAGLVISTANALPLSLSTNNTECMRIDSSGRVTTPFQPAFQAYCNQATNSTTAGTVPFNTTRLNVGSHFNTSTYTFTAPVAGSYFFTVSVYVQANSNAYLNLQLRKNGTTLFYTETSATTIQLSLTTSMVMTLSAGDAVTAGVGNNGSRQYYQGGTETSFSGYLIG